MMRKGSLAMRSSWNWFVFLFWCLGLPAAPAQAAPVESWIEARGILGYSTFLDESPLHHFVSGGAVRFNLTRRLAVEPEFLSMYRSKRDLGFYLVPNLVFNLTGRPSRVRPYLIGGVGIAWQRELTGAGYYWSRGLIHSAGFGTRVFLTDRLYVAPEVRFGWEPVLRVAGSIGYVFSGNE
ncbi:MAG: hypothetical protein AB1898_03515 [Acidobacteriota bacterium]